MILVETISYEREIKDFSSSGKTPLVTYIEFKSKTMNVTERCNTIKDEMLAKLEQQKQEFIKAYIKTYGEYPKCYADEEKKGK